MEEAFSSPFGGGVEGGGQIWTQEISPSELTEILARAGWISPLGGRGGEGGEVAAPSAGCWSARTCIATSEWRSSRAKITLDGLASLASLALAAAFALGRRSLSQRRRANLL